MRKMKTLSGFWIIIMFGLFTLFGVYVLYYNSNQPYIELEQNMETIVKENNDLIDEVGSNKYVKVMSSSFKDQIKMAVDDDKCDGYVVFRDLIVFKYYKAYISCEDYKTIGFK